MKNEIVMSKVVLSKVVLNEDATSDLVAKLLKSASPFKATPLPDGDWSIAFKQDLASALSK